MAADGTASPQEIGEARVRHELAQRSHDREVRGASDLEQMVRKWEDEEVAVRRLMDGQHKMFEQMAEQPSGAQMSNWAAEGTPTRDPATPTRTGAPATSPAPGGLLLTPSLSLMSRSPTIRGSPVMRKSMDLLMARQQKIWGQVADTLGTRVSVMLSNPPIEAGGSSKAAAEMLHEELPPLPPISESVAVLKNVYSSAHKPRKERARDSSRPKPRKLSTESDAAGHPPSPIRTLPDLGVAGAPLSVAVAAPATQQPKLAKKTGAKKKKKKKKKAKAKKKAKPEWDGGIEGDGAIGAIGFGAPKPLLPAGPSAGVEAPGIVRTKSNRPAGADPLLEATQLENKWDQIRGLMGEIQEGWEGREGREGVRLPQIVAQIARASPTPGPAPSARDKKAEKWRRKAEQNRRKVEEAQRLVFVGGGANRGRR